MDDTAKKEMSMEEAIGYIKRYQEQSGKSQAAVAQELGISSGSFVRIPFRQLQDSPHDYPENRKPGGAAGKKEVFPAGTVLCADQCFSCR